MLLLQEGSKGIVWLTTLGEGTFLEWPTTIQRGNFSGWYSSLRVQVDFNSSSISLVCSEGYLKIDSVVCRLLYTCPQSSSSSASTAGFGSSHWLLLVIWSVTFSCSVFWLHEKSVFLKQGSNSDARAYTSVNSMLTKCFLWSNPPKYICLFHKSAWLWVCKRHILGACLIDKAATSRPPCLSSLCHPGKVPTPRLQSIFLNSWSSRTSIQ